MSDPDERLRLAPDDLRWHCAAEALDFETTAGVEPLAAFVGQDDAVDALEFGLATAAPGQNVYVRGLPGTGRLSLVQRELAFHPGSSTPAPDHAYVHCFAHPDRPRLLTVAHGRGRELADRMDEWVQFVRDDLGPALNAEPLRKRREALQERFQSELATVRAPFEAELKDNDLTMVTAEVGQQVRTFLLPVIEGEAAPPERMQELVQAGKLDDERVKAIQAKLETYGKRLGDLAAKMQERQTQHAERMRKVLQDEARTLLDAATRALRTRFEEPEVRQFLDECVAEVVHRGTPQDADERDAWLRRFRVNVVSAHDPDEGPPVVIESTPTIGNLLGGIERRILPGGQAVSDHTMVSGGSLLRADGGTLILEARDVVSEPGAWKVLVRTLRTGQLEIVPSELFGPWGGRTIKPDPIPVRIKVVLVGEPDLYYLLDENDPDFSQLFKVLADFDSVLPCSRETVAAYGGFVSRLAREEEDVPHFDRSGVARLAEHGARIAGRSDRLTARFGRIADIAREAGFVARSHAKDLVDADDVREAIRRTRRRANMPARRYREAIREGTIRIEVDGQQVGQVNGLAVITAGPLTFGFPTRITATIGAGQAGAIDVERESQLSGRIHTKGFHIVQGLLRHLLRVPHPLAFSASLAFEQSYGGIDGDSASGAETCCLFSALTGVALRQDLAMTGAIDQHGRIQAVGAVTEKTEGFFAACNDLGLTGTQGVVLPRTNVRDLMLDEEVVEACRAGRFHVYAVDTIQEALEVFTGVPAGVADSEGIYPEGSLLAMAVDRAFEFWTLASVRPDVFLEDEEEEGEGGGEGTKPAAASREAIRRRRAGGK